MKCLPALLLLTAAATVHAQRQTLPEFIAGDQCLFCHRNDIGPAWSRNAHNLTVRPINGSDENFTLGARESANQRRLKKLAYGKFAILSKDGSAHQATFGARCAGCHTTAVNAGTLAFSEFAIDCYACHGVVDLEHSNDTSLIFLSRKRRSDAKMITSTCASCHLRGGASKAKGLPYAYHFVPGDDLFADYAADFKLATDPSLNAGDRHVYRNVRDVLESSTEVTCLSCHALHLNSTQKHRRVLTSPACLDCHYETGPRKGIKKYNSTHPICTISP